MTDNGLAALAAALHHYRGTCELWTISEAACPIDHRVDAAAILAERGVFLPEGLPEVSIKGLLEDFDGAPYPEDFQRAVAVREADYLGQIATLRAALEDMVAWLASRDATNWSPGWSEDYRNGYDTAVEEVRTALATAEEADHD